MCVNTWSQIRIKNSVFIYTVSPSLLKPCLCQIRGPTRINLMAPDAVKQVGNCPTLLVSWSWGNCLVASASLFALQVGFYSLDQPHSTPPLPPCLSDCESAGSFGKQGKSDCWICIFLNKSYGSFAISRAPLFGSLSSSLIRQPKTSTIHVYIKHKWL